MQTHPGVGSQGGDDPLGLSDIIATPWTFSLTCAGEYATSTSVDTRGYIRWKFPLGIEWDAKAGVATAIDYHINCDGAFYTTVTGTGGILRRVGVEYGQTVTTRDPTLGSSTDVVRSEDENSCSYIVNFCSISYSQSRPDVLDEFQFKVDSKPKTRCVMAIEAGLPPAMEAYNRAQHPDPIGLLETTTEVKPEDTTECKQVSITWTEVDSIDPPEMALLLA